MMDKGRQVQLGMTLRQGVGYNSVSGPTVDIAYEQDYQIPFDPRLYVHMIVLGKSGSGKGIFSTSLGLWLMDNYSYSFIDCNSGTDFENGMYPFAQEDENMLARLNDTFFLNKVGGYEFEMFFPYGFLEEHPVYFSQPFCVSYKDLTTQDFRFFYPGRTDKVEIFELVNLVNKVNSTEEFLGILLKKYKEIYEPFKVMVDKGFITNETVIDIESLSDPKVVHGFAASFIDRLINDDRVSGFIMSLFVRLLQDSRQGSLKKKPCSLYIRESTMLEDTMFRTMATRGRHTNTHLICDTQRRITLLDKTSAQQFGSYALFSCRSEMAFEYMQGYGLDDKMAFALSRAGVGIGAINFDGMSEPLFPVAVSPPVCGYKDPRKDYMEMCKEKGVEFVQAE